MKPVVAFAIVLYRDPPKYNERRRGLWQPDVASHHCQGLRRTASSPDLDVLGQADSKYSALVQNISAWCSGSCGDGTEMLTHLVDSARSSRPESTSRSTHCIDCVIIRYA